MGNDGKSVTTFNSYKSGDNNLRML